MRNNQFHNGTPRPAFMGPKCKVAVPVRDALLRDALLEASLAPAVRAIADRQRAEPSLAGVVGAAGMELFALCPPGPWHRKTRPPHRLAATRRSGVAGARRRGWSYARDPVPPRAIVDHRRQPGRRNRDMRAAVCGVRGSFRTTHRRADEPGHKTPQPGGHLRGVSTRCSALMPRAASTEQHRDQGSSDEHQKQVPISRQPHSGADPGICPRVPKRPPTEHARRRVDCAHRA